VSVTIKSASVSVGKRQLMIMRSVNDDAMGKVLVRLGLSTQLTSEKTSGQVGSE
jgi:hypothetical protein